MKLLKRLKSMCLWSLLVGLLLTPGRSTLAQEGPPSTVTREQLTRSLPECAEAVDGLTRLFALWDYILIPDRTVPGLFRISYVPRRFLVGGQFFLQFLPEGGQPPELRKNWILERSGKCLMPNGKFADYYLYQLGGPNKEPAQF